MIRAFFRALVQFQKHRGPFLAAGLSFYLIITLIPLALLVVSATGFLLSDGAAQRGAIDQLTQLLPVYAKQVEKMLGTVISSRRFSGALGTLIMVLISTQLFAALRYVMDQVFGVARGHGFVVGWLRDLLAVAVMGAMFLGSIAATAVFYWLQVFVFTKAHVPPIWIRFLFDLLGVALHCGLFYFVYRYFPNCDVRKRSAFSGALLAALLWEGARVLFRNYVQHFGTFDAVYGPLGVIVAAMTFVYYSGIVVIVGAEFAAANDGRGASPTGSAPPRRKRSLS